MTKIEDTLKERGNRYGTFDDNAAYAQAIKDVMRKSPNWSKMTEAQREGLDFIASKMGRILSGDPNYTDSWHDIAGFASLVEKSIVARALEIEREEYNRRVDEDAYKTWLKENTWGNDTRPLETGDYDPIHLIYTTAITSPDFQVRLSENPYYDHNENVIFKDAGQPYTSPAPMGGMVGSEVLGICPQQPATDGDEMAPSQCVSRCY